MGSAEAQGRLWGADDRAWSELTEPHCAPLYETVFDTLEIGEDKSLSDAGCGAGLALQLAAKRGAVVSGLDASEALLEIARERNPRRAFNLVRTMIGCPVARGPSRRYSNLCSD
jgi:2-polyprenyl-3-methyl-5-hydroxy-6-metoxy-1,4-benzoquinol methylase